MKRVSLMVLLAFVVLGRASPPPPVDDSPADCLRIAGSSEMRPLVEAWRKIILQRHPTWRIELQLQGSDVAMAALYSQRADLALLGREATAAEVKAFEWIYRYRPTAVEIATGSLGAAGRSPALVVLVHRENPLSSLTLTQLDAVFSHERLRGAPAAVRVWGDLGLEGEWRDQPIRLYAPDTESGTGRFFRAVVLKDSRLLAWDNFREFADSTGRPPQHDAAVKMIGALAEDRFGLAVAGANPATLGAKALALDGVMPTRDNLVARRYPLARPIFAYANRAPNAPLSPKVSVFLRGVLSAEGQNCVERDRAYLPLAAEMVRAQLGKLE